MTTTTWDIRRAAANLAVQLIPFDLVQGEGSRGYSLGRELAIRPGEPHPIFIALHEFAHIVLGHTYNHTRHSGLSVDDSEIMAHTVALALAKDLKLRAGIDYEPEDEFRYLASYAHTPRHLLEITATNHKGLRRAAKKIYEAGLLNY